MLIKNKLSCEELAISCIKLKLMGKMVRNKIQHNTAFTVINNVL